MAVDTSKAIHKQAPKMTKAEKTKYVKDMNKLKYDKPNNSVKDANK